MVGPKGGAVVLGCGAVIGPGDGAVEYGCGVVERPSGEELEYTLLAPGPEGLGAE